MTNIIKLNESEANQHFIVALKIQQYLRDKHGDNNKIDVYLDNSNPANRYPNRAILSPSFPTPGIQGDRSNDWNHFWHIKSQKLAEKTEGLTYVPITTSGSGTSYSYRFMIECPENLSFVHSRSTEVDHRRVEVFACEQTFAETTFKKVRACEQLDYFVQVLSNFSDSYHKLLEYEKDKRLRQRKERFAEWDHESE